MILDNYIKKLNGFRYFSRVIFLSLGEVFEEISIVLCTFMVK